MAGRGRRASDDPLIGLKPPKLPNKIVKGLSDEQLRALIDACKGTRFIDRRDHAIVRLMAETGIRSSELTALRVADVDLKRGLVAIQKGKGAKGRIAPFGPQTAAALDRYLRARRSHSLASTSALWLRYRGQGLRVLRAQRCVAGAGQEGRDRGFSPTSATQHCGNPVAGCRRLRRWPHVNCGLVEPKHAGPLYAGDGSGAGGGGGAEVELGRRVTEVTIRLDERAVLTSIN